MGLFGNFILRNATTRSDCHGVTEWPELGLLSTRDHVSKRLGSSKNRTPEHPKRYREYRKPEQCPDRLTMSVFIPTDSLQHDGM